MAVKEKDLTYAATARCPCGAGLAYVTKADHRINSGDPHGGHWDCSAIILGEAIPSGQPGAVKHEARLPFTFYEIKSEGQPSARGATTRPVH